MLKKKGSRELVICGIFILLFACLIVRMYKLQIIEGAEFSNNFELRSKKEISLKGMRGAIYDKNGEVLASNKLVYAVTLEDCGNYDTERERNLSLNSEIYHMLNLLKQNDEALNNGFKIYINENGKYRFSESGVSLKRFKADVFGKAKIEEMSDEQADATAEEIIDYLKSEQRFCLEGQKNNPYTKEEKEEYSLPEKFTQEEELKVIAVRYMLSLNTYQRYIPITIASDVSEKTVAAVLENQDKFIGVKIAEDSIRVYEGGDAFASIIGYTGVISGEELEENEDKYTHQSIVGKAGVEQSMDQSLQGKDGVKEVYVNNVGKIISDEETLEEPVTGKDIYLSIDKNLQIKTYKIIEKQLADIIVGNLIQGKEFDKTSVKDASEIKIPVYDTYYSLIGNNVVNVDELSRESASELEQSILARFQAEKNSVMGQLSDILLNQTITYQDTEKEMQTYQSFIVKNLDLFTEDNEENLAKKQELDQKWSSGEVSIMEYLTGCIEIDSIKRELLKSDEVYLTGDQAYQLLVDYIMEELGTNKTFDRLIYKYMLLDDVIYPKEVCLLLYEQEILSKEDEAYEKLLNDQISSYEFIVEKIKAVEITPAQLALDPCSASVVITETGTGKILACVSYPGYDNNRLANQMDNDYYYKLYNDKSIPFYNRATQQLSAPGSTFKPITVVAGLEEQQITPTTDILCDGVFDKVETELRCWKRSGHGTIMSAAEALQHSCNDYLCDISYRLGYIGNDRYMDGQALSYLQKYANLFDLDKKSGIELTESEPHVTDINGIPSAIGQGNNNFATVQLGRYVNTLANGGTSYNLSLIKQIGDEEKQPEVESEVELSSSTWDVVHTGMELYAQESESLKDFQIPVAGKSGTAQESKTRPDHALFIGYAPADNPEISIAVRIVNGYASRYAVDGSRKILEEYFELNNEE